jgi:hypothetical protein
MKEELRRRGWRESEVKERRNDPEKLEMEARLRKETTLTVKGNSTPDKSWQFQKCQCKPASMDA